MGVQFTAFDERSPHPKYKGAFTSVKVPLFDFCNANASVFAGLLGIDHMTDDGLVGSITIAEARRAIIRTRATFDRRVKDFVRPDERFYGEPSANEDGTIELRPLCMLSRGIDEAYLRKRLEDFVTFVAEAELQGATHIAWS